MDEDAVKIIEYFVEMNRYFGDDALKSHKTTNTWRNTVVMALHSEEEITWEIKRQ